ncbi:hypothetical protein F5Y00DRAFT_54109 [Daldinia vernicosa]|uniref:uncharacterized protein n=1 Tax=Daldinia vernicosa TaxID=114800 RepID=UPI002008AE04|nr:uncharacterized protein F5Y00DRAFT_54109 [Daldinia vernicosa]KAI0849585.1 hypothetical protein F5Y00DRAFT_54109 [Daldinia vernicosa]
MLLHDLRVSTWLCMLDPPNIFFHFTLACVRLRLEAGSPLQYTSIVDLHLLKNIGNSIRFRLLGNIRQSNRLFGVIVRVNMSHDLKSGHQNVSYPSLNPTNTRFCINCAQHVVLDQLHRCIECGQDVPRSNPASLANGNNSTGTGARLSGPSLAEPDCALSINNLINNEGKAKPQKRDRIGETRKMLESDIWSPEQLEHSAKSSATRTGH